MSHSQQFWKALTILLILAVRGLVAKKTTVLGLIWKIWCADQSVRATEQQAEQRQKTNAQKHSKAFVGSSVGCVVK